IVAPVNVPVVINIAPGWDIGFIGCNRKLDFYVKVIYIYKLQHKLQYLSYFTPLVVHLPKNPSQSRVVLFCVSPEISK
ncbi:MAG: hypothetical protein RLZZ86_2113, partial [Cyanobacteriota bacterium]